MHHQYDEPVYLISIVSKMLDIHPQTLRQYERENLVCPSRTNGRIRLYSLRDIDKIKLILRLTRDLGVNLAGVDIILRLKDNVDCMEQDMIDLKQELQRMRKEPTDKALVTKKSLYEMVIFEK
ncbi:MAG: helix-turn-helix transcriptional regulator [Sulfurimonas sp.]